MKKLFAYLIIGMFLLTFVTAQQPSLGTFKQGENVRITQVCSDATYINISSVSYPNSSVAVSNIEMTSAGSGEFFYDFNSTLTLGKYDVRGISDGCTNTFATWFDVTKSGLAFVEGFSIPLFLPIIMIILVAGVVMFLGFRINYEGIKTTMIGFSLVLLLFGVGYSFFIIDNIFAGFDGIVFGFSLFYRMILIIFFISLMLFVIYMIIRSIEYIKNIRGLK